MPVSLRALYSPTALAADRRCHLHEDDPKVHPKDPHWYLLLLVADPRRSDVGVGTLLMEDGLARLDAERVGSYLETQKEDNLAYYRRFGYELRDTVNPVAGGPPYYTMWRAPR